MNDMMRNFGDPFAMHPHALEGPRDPRGDHRQRNQQELMPHSGFMGDMMGPMSMFSNMDSMFRNMHRQMVS